MSAKFQVGDQVTHKMDEPKIIGVVISGKLHEHNRYIYKVKEHTGDIENWGEPYMILHKAANPFKSKVVIDWTKALNFKLRY